jgi:hypothetical protein
VRMRTVSKVIVCLLVGQFGQLVESAPAAGGQTAHMCAIPEGGQTWPSTRWHPQDLQTRYLSPGGEK